MHWNTWWLFVITGLVAGGDHARLTVLYHRTCELVSVAVIPAGLTVALFARECILVWTGSPAIAARASLAASLLAGGQLLQAITAVPYYVALANGNVKLNLYVGAASVVVITPVLLILVSQYGVAGAGFSWLLMNLCTLPPYMYFLHRRFLRGELRRWVLFDLLRPLGAALPVVLLARWYFSVPGARLHAAGLLGLVWMLSCGAAAFATPELRNAWNLKLKLLLYSVL